MSIWGLLAMLTMGFPGVSVDEPSVHAPVEQEVRIENEQNYLVVEQIEGEMARLESEAGMFWVPLGALPEFARQEGTVLEWRDVPSEGVQRRAAGQARIDRLVAMSGTF